MTYFDGQNDVPLSNKGEVFAPYKSKQKEIGIKYDGGRLGMSAALLPTAKPLPAVVGSRATLSGEQRNQGLELSVFGTPMAGVRLLGGLTWLDTQQRKTDKPANQGKNAIGAPTTQLSVGGEWDVLRRARLEPECPHCLHLDAVCGSGQHTKQLLPPGPASISARAT